VPNRGGIFLDSKPGEGTIVWIFLPLGEPTRHLRENEKSVIAGKGGHRSREPVDQPVREADKKVKREAVAKVIIGALKRMEGK